MTGEEAAGLVAFIKEFDPRYETSTPLYSAAPCVRAQAADGTGVTYYSIAYYADEACQKVDNPEFQLALKRWLSEQQGQE